MITARSNDAFLCASTLCGLRIQSAEPDSPAPAQVSGSLDRGAGAAVWSRWQALLGCLGFALVPQAVALATVGPAACGTAPALVGAVLGIALTAAIGSPTAQQEGSDVDAEPGLRRWRPFWATVPAWSASLLLMLQPVKLLVRFALTMSL